jgi:hypothetical protein
MAPSRFPEMTVRRRYRSWPSGAGLARLSFEDCDGDGRGMIPEDVESMELGTERLVVLVVFQSCQDRWSVSRYSDDLNKLRVDLL